MTYSSRRALISRGEGMALNLGASAFRRAGDEARHLAVVAAAEGAELEALAVALAGAPASPLGH
jgi:hypothetical protein